MLVLRSPDEAARIADPDIRNLVQLRFAQVCAGEPYDPDRHGYMLVVEPGDTVQTIERESGIPVLTDLFGEARFGDPEFTPAAEVIEDRGTVLRAGVHLHRRRLRHRDLRPEGRRRRS